MDGFIFIQFDVTVQHGGGDMKPLVTGHPQSGSRQRRMLVLGPPACGMVQPSIRVSLSSSITRSRNFLTNVLRDFFFRGDSDPAE